MSEGTKAERIIKYKEQRRKQLAAQFATHSDPSSRKQNGKDTNSSSSEGPRTTRASRLRAAAAAAQENPSSPPHANRVSYIEKPPTTPPETALTVNRQERDKSSKRKSNLNRSLNSEEVIDTDDAKNRRRRRRFFPQEVFDQVKENKRDSNFTASFLSQSSTSPITAAPAASRMSPRKSDLSVHMENARKGLTPPYSEMGAKYKPFVASKLANTSSPREKLKFSDPDNSQSDKDINKENKKKYSVTSSRTKTSTDNNAVAKKMEELTALTRETLARVEKLATFSKESANVKSIKRPPSSSPIKQLESSQRRVTRSSSNKIQQQQPSSILKKKSVEEPIIVESVPNAAPVSILKRKVSQDEKSETHTPPVTFSPSVVEPATTNRKQGILKKRRSLDESQVMRHRSCSPDVANKFASDSRSILKNQRRSSLEELTRTESPELQLHGILKRKPSRTDDDDHSLNSPQSILKRRSGASSAGSSVGTPHVSITTAVILAAAGGAEMVLNESETVRPILKKKSFSDDHSYNSDYSCSDVPRPILKKKSSTDTDDCDDRPKKPILKMSRNSLERDNIESTFDNNVTNRNFSNFKQNIPNNDDSFDCDSVKPILKQNGAKDDQPTRPRLSFGGEHIGEGHTVKYRNSHRSNTICAEFNSSLFTHPDSKDEDRDLKKARPLSVCDLVMSFESSTSTGAIPKRSSMKRSSDRYRTQPVTSNELEASLNFVRSPQFPKSSTLFSPEEESHSISSLDFTSSLENDYNLNSFLSSLHKTSPDSGVCGKMSSDSAFQSLGDGLELDQDEDRTRETSIKPAKLETNSLALQMKAIAEEAKNKRLGKANVGGVSKYRPRKAPSSDSRFSTQPVTFEEVQEASRINKDSEDSEDKADPCNLSLSERIKLFSSKVNQPAPPIRETPKLRHNRFQTQPVTSTEVKTARCIPYATHALEDLEKSFNSDRKKGILKSSSSSNRPSALSPPRSVLKKRDSFDGSSDYDSSSNRRSILRTEIPDITYDEGISCNDSGSDSEVVTVTPSKTEEVKVKREEARSKVQNMFGKSSSDATSDGDSSGGREIRSIFRSENKLKVKQALESVLSKSKSQSAFGDEVESSAVRKTNIRRSQTQSAMPQSIAEIQAKLQQSGESGWKKRFQQNSSDDIKLMKDKNKYNDELSEKSILAAKKDELDAAAVQWKCRVEKSDAEKFSVAGRMEKNKDLSINIPTTEHKKTPQAKRFKGKEGSDSSSTPASPDKNKYGELTRSYSVPDPDKDFSDSDTSLRVSGRKVSIARPDDFTFKNFYRSIEEKRTKIEQIEVSLDDFDFVPKHTLLVQKKNVQVQRRRGASRNPIKALASRTDISNEYTEIVTGVAEREKKRLNIEKLAKNSNLAVEALAGLASKEDFTSIALKKSSAPSSMVPFNDVMLLQVKGRRHVQTRLVEPVFNSINEGDNYILVTGSTCYNYIGAYSNVIEQSRAADIVNHIQQTGDLGCKNVKVVNLDEKNMSPSPDVEKFLKILGCAQDVQFTSGGHPDEDEIYEANILATNMIYGLDGDELVPLDEFWGTIPKIEMLQPTRVYVFDFGSEMYVWSGKNAPLDKKKLVLKLAKEMWDDGFNYSECAVNPLNVASMLGNRPSNTVPLKGNKRPDWALFAKITQHRETILFKEKFLDWPDFSRVIRVKGDESEKSVDPSYHISPCDVNEMLKRDNVNRGPDLIVEGHHLGRGNEYFDEETKRLFEFDTLEISVWRILENHSEKLSDQSVGHFYDCDSYIIRWNYRMTVKGRELSGKPSKFAQAGRDRSVYFCWQGSNASVNEKGLAALLTVELDSEKAPQIRVVQGLEPAAFLRLFKGSMIVHKGKRDEPENSEKPRLFMVRGELEEEVSLIEVSCDSKDIRSRTSFVLVDSEADEITIWHGAKSNKHTKNLAKSVVNRIIDRKSEELFLQDSEDIELVEVEEGKENDEFLNVVDVKSRNKYVSLMESGLTHDFTMRLFYLSSISGTFKATEILCPYRSENSSPFPFSQNELYSASQPALFLIDNHHELWLWQGWWPEREEEVELHDQTGSGAVRWQAERKAAMQTTVDYWMKDHSGDQSIPAYLVWAGLEPLEFKNIFPCWTDREDVTDLNVKEGRKPNSKLSVEKQLTLLQRTVYPLAELLQRPLPEGVDPTHLEIYLSPDDFQELLSMSKEEFQKLPPWKKTALKKEKGLF